jgi:hypothetical protein
MDLNIHRPQAVCARTGRGFSPAEPFVSALVRAEGRIERRDYSLEAWTGPPSETLAWWRSTYPSASAGGAALAPADVLLDVLEELEGHDDDAALRYLVALELVRRRAVKFVDRPAETPARSAAAAEIVVACRRREREYRVRTVSAAEAAAPGVEERLAALLWSGGAA